MINNSDSILMKMIKVTPPEFKLVNYVHDIIKHVLCIINLAVS